MKMYLLWCDEIDWRDLFGVYSSPEKVTAAIEKLPDVYKTTYKDQLSVEEITVDVSIRFIE